MVRFGRVRGLQSERDKKENFSSGRRALGFYLAGRELWPWEDLSLTRRGGK